MKITKDIDVFTNDLLNNKVVCFKTDTIWGLSANPYNEEAVKNLYKIKKRNVDKPFIFLIKENEKLEDYAILSNTKEIEIIKNVWPGPISIVFSFNTKSNLLNLYKNKETIAFRMPKNKLCKKILNKIPFPLPSTSVNIEGQAPLNTLKEIKEFLKDEDVTILNLNAYYKNKKASTIIKMTNNQIEVLRKGDLSKKILDALNV